MKIWFQTSDGETALCDHGGGGPSNFTPQVVRKMDVLMFVQSPFATPRARGNAYRTWSFTATKTHASYAAAERYLVTLHQSVPEQAEVYMELSDDVTRFVLPQCCISFQATAPVGVKTMVTWTLTFGVMNELTRGADALGIDLNDSAGTELYVKGEDE